ncbi:hypothetical protein [Roseomonas cutis]|uniref:hypothetical protein n=1 Tax=Roseomonas cutis TaxID=2897332 RepID=UPI00272B297C|nr:hypothetical protein [Roseomonas sp. OT10]
MALALPILAGAVPAMAAMDRSGREYRGEVSVLPERLAGRRLSDGRPYDPESAAASSARLPVGSTARITNLANGRVAMIRIHERPRRAQAGREGDSLKVSPRVARLLQLAEGGEAPVLVAPLAVPQADGTIRLGQGTGFDGQPAVIVHPERG